MIDTAHGDRFRRTSIGFVFDQTSPEDPAGCANDGMPDDSFNTATALQWLAGESDPDRIAIGGGPAGVASPREVGTPRRGTGTRR